MIDKATFSLSLPLQVFTRFLLILDIRILDMVLQDSTIDAKVEACLELYDGPVSGSESSDSEITDAEVQHAKSGLEELVEDNEEDYLRCVLRIALAVN